LVEHPSAGGVVCAGCVGSVERTAIFDGEPGGQDGPGAGVVVGEGPDTLIPAELTIEGVHIARARGAGILAGTSVLDVRHSTIIDMQPNALSHEGHGIHLSIQNLGDGVDATIDQTLVSGSIANGILVADSRATLTGVSVRDTASYTSGPNEDLIGMGIQVRTTAGENASATIIGSHLQNNHAAGVLAVDGEATITGTLVEDTAADAGGFGFGISARTLLDSPFEVTVEDTRIEGSEGVGLLVGGASLIADRVTVADTTLSPAGISSSGIIVQHDGASLGGSALLTRVLVENSHDVGIAVFGSQAQVRGSTITDTGSDADGLFGDGLLVSSDLVPATLEIDGVSIANSTRAAVANFGATASYERSWLVCQAFDLDGETSPLGDFVFEDLGGNAAGCDAPMDECLVVTAELEAPSFLDLP
jgi:hypothetical protein